MDTRQFSKLFHQRILKPRIAILRRRLPLLTMMPMPAAGLGCGGIARRQPMLANRRSPANYLDKGDKANRNFCTICGHAWGKF